jgi:Mg2+ and Co2+ transporter CorA
VTSVDERLIEMTNEDFEKKMEFMIEQQAQSVAQIGQLEALVGRFANAVSQRFEALEEGMSRRFNDVDEKIAALVDSQIRLSEAQSRTEESLKMTDEKLRNLIAVVDRYFSEGRNGKSEK